MLTASQGQKLIKQANDKRLLELQTEMYKTYCYTFLGWLQSVNPYWRNMGEEKIVNYFFTDSVFPPYMQDFLARGFTAKVAIVKFLTAQWNTVAPLGCAYQAKDMPAYEHETTDNERRYVNETRRCCQKF